MPFSPLVRRVLYSLSVVAFMSVCVAQQDQTPIKPNPEVQVLLDKGRSLLDQGKPTDAAIQLKSAISKAEELKDVSGQAATWSALADAYAAVQDVDNERSSLVKALEFQKKVGDKNACGKSSIQLAALLRDTEPDSGLTYATQAVSALKNTKELQWLVVAHLVHGDLLNVVGRRQEAMQAMVDAANLCHKAGLKPLEARSLSDLGRAYEDAGLFSAALECYDASSNIFAREGIDSGEAVASLNLGIVNEKIGRHDVAQDAFQRALSLFDSLGDQRSYASALQNLGSAQNSAGEREEAKKTLEKALGLHKTLGNRSGEAGCLGTLGDIARDAKEYSKAQSYLTESADMFRETGEKLDEATALDSLGSVYYDQNQFEKAVEQFDKAITIYDSIHATSYAATSYGNRAQCMVKLGKLDEADKSFTEAVSRFESVRDSLGELSEAKSTYLSRRASVYRDYVNVLSLRNKADEAFDLVQKMKARALLDLMSTGRVAESSMTSEEALTERALRDKADNLNSRMLQEGVLNQVGSKARYDALAKELREIERKLGEFTDMLCARDPRMRNLRTAETTTTLECGKLLPEDTALIEYALSDNAVISVVLRKDNGVLKVTSHSRSFEDVDIAAQCRQLRLACSSPSGDYQALSSSLYQTLVSPLEKEIAGKTRLIVCPDSYLWDVPFAVLKKDNGEDLIDTFEIAYAYSATGAKAALQPKAQTSQAIKDLLVVANPDFGQGSRFQNLKASLEARPIDTPSRPIDQPSRPIDQPSRAIDSLSRAIDSLSRENSGSAGAIKPLPGTQREADGLKSVFPSATVLTGADAQESRAKELSKDYRYLHFATHGFVNDAAPLLSTLILSQPEGDSKDDGFLTAREIYSMKLQAEMVVLSACNTARGEVRSGEGMIGLSWALFVAGCKCEVVSQWSVDDAVGADLMVDFYRSLAASGSTKGQSLRTAALKIKSEASHSHPYYWAPFVLIGDWR